jgi:hypothetical protein
LLEGVASKQDERAKGHTEQHPARKLGNDEFGTEEDNVDRNEFAKIDHGPLGRIILGVGEGSAGRSSRKRLSETTFDDCCFTDRPEVSS